VPDPSQPHLLHLDHPRDRAQRCLGLIPLGAGAEARQVISDLVEGLGRRSPVDSSWTWTLSFNSPTRRLPGDRVNEPDCAALSTTPLVGAPRHDE
jgi:hypothetical protein